MVCTEEEHPGLLLHKRGESPNMTFGFISCVTPTVCLPSVNCTYYAEWSIGIIIISYEHQWGLIQFRERCVTGIMTTDHIILISKQN